MDPSSSAELPGRLWPPSHRVQAPTPAPLVPPPSRPSDGPPPFEPPTSMIAPLFLRRLERIHSCRVEFELDINTRPTRHVLGGYYRSRRLVRIYTHDTRDGRRPFRELFETFLHEVAHHLEYTEPQTFHSKVCHRVPGRMHSQLFWRILGELKFRWAEVVARHRSSL